MKFLVSKGHNEQEVVEKIKNGEELKVDEESECLGPVVLCEGACSQGGPWGSRWPPVGSSWGAGRSGGQDRVLGRGVR